MRWSSIVSETDSCTCALEGGESVAFEPDWWESTRDRTAYHVNRADLLHKLLLDHVLWGQAQVTAINQAFLAAHLRILRSVMHDLARCGPEGQRLNRIIVADHLRLLGDQEEALA